MLESSNSFTPFPEKISETNISNEKKPVRAHEEETATIGSKDFFQSILSEELEKCSSVEEAHEKTKEIIDGFENDLGQKAKGFTESLEKVSFEDFASIHDYVISISSVLEQSIHERFSLEELEDIERNDILGNEMNVGVNQVIYYQFLPEQKEMTINIHNVKSLPFKEMMHGFGEGLHEIARQLKNNPELAGVEKITARSWIIEKHPRLTERYGFKLDGIDSAYISKDDFIEKYGD